MKKTILLIIGILAVHMGHSQTAYLFRPDLEKANQIYRLNLETMNEALFYKGYLNYVSDLQISADGKYIAFIEKDPDGGQTEIREYGDQKLPYKPAKTKLSVANLEGVLIQQIDSVLSAIWHPNGLKIAMTIGTKMPEMRAETVAFVILDIETGGKIRINGRSDYPTAWITTDLENSIYFESGRKYSLDRNRFEKTNLSSGYVSPDGKYYWNNRSEGCTNNCEGIFSVKTNQLLTPFSQDMGKPVGWVYSEGHLFMYNKKSDRLEDTYTVNTKNGPVTRKRTVGYGQATNYVYDVETKELVQEFNGFTFDSWYNRNPWKGNNETVVSTPAGSAENQRARSQNIIIKTIPDQYKNE